MESPGRPFFAYWERAVSMVALALNGILRSAGQRGGVGGVLDGTAVHQPVAAVHNQAANSSSESSITARRTIVWPLSLSRDGRQRKLFRMLGHTRFMPDKNRCGPRSCGVNPHIPHLGDEILCVLQRPPSGGRTWATGNVGSGKRLFVPITPRPQETVLAACLRTCEHPVAIASPSISGAAARITLLYEEYAASMFRFALHLTGRREDAEDVVQFVFIQAFGQLEDGNELSNPRAWLMRATKNRSLNLIRDRRELPTDDLRVESRPSDSADRDELAALAAVRATLWALPETQHQAFVLRYWSGLSQNEIADVLSTTAGAVESLLIRARAALANDSAAIDTQCGGVRERLVGALYLRAEDTAHIASCRKCRTAQSRITRTAQLRPHWPSCRARTWPARSRR